MRIPIAPLHLVDLAAAELEYITQASESGADAWKEAVLQWHCEAMARARVEALVPGMARSQDPIVEKVLKRFCHDRVGAALRGLIAENLKLRRDLIDALRRIRLHQRGGSTQASELRSHKCFVFRLIFLIRRATNALSSDRNLTLRCG